MALARPLAIFVWVAAAVVLVTAPAAASAALRMPDATHNRARHALDREPFALDLSSLQGALAGGLGARQLPRRLRAERGPSAAPAATNVAVSNQFECNPLPLGGTAPPGVRSICYDISVPLFYNDTSQGNITVFVRRTFVGEPGQGDLLWMLPGGSGVASWAEASIAAPVVYGLHAQLNVSWDVLMMDKRGTGNSSYIGCPYPLLATDGITKCTAYLNNNPAAARVFSSVSYTATALDVKSTVDVLTDWDNPNQRVFVMGSSNGAYLAQRYMQVAPTQADAIILDALLPPDLFRLVRNEYNMNTLGLDLMARCAADDGCRQMFNGTYGDGGAEPYVGPMQALETLKLASSYGDVPCLTKLNATYMQFAESWANQLYWYTWSLVPPLVRRLMRCNDDDVTALTQYLKLTAPPPLAPDTPMATLLVEARNDWSELWSGPGNPALSCGEITGMYYGTFFSNNVGDIECPAREQAVATGDFVYTPNPTLYQQYSDAQVPTLAMNGQMDQAVPVAWARHAARRYQAVNPKHFHYVEMPRTAHVPSTESPVADSASSCGWSLIVSFLLSPSYTPDTSCVADIIPIDFAGTTAAVQASSKQFLGTPDMWGSN